MPEWKVPGYSELKMLGSGGFGDVMLARHDPTGTLVAIKYLRRELLADAEFTQLFRAEATVLALLDDPNVVRLYEYVESPDGAAIVMELIGGVTLREILTFQGKTTAEAALVVLRGSLLGLAAAHRRGVVHRDFKPENVLVNGDGISKLTDFGIAARVGDLPVPAGTLLYAAPEQLAGALASPATDVYAATATFYECLTGRPPFQGGTDDLIRQHRFAPVPMQAVPEPLRPLVAAGMAKDPRGRPADATTFVTELSAVASGAYGRDWPERGRSHLGEAALLLAALWPAGPPPAVQGTAVHRVPLGTKSASRSASRRAAARRRVRPRQAGAAKIAVMAGAAIFAVAAGAALASTVANRPGPPQQPVAAVQPVTLQPPSAQITLPASSSSALPSSTLPSSTLPSSSLPSSSSPPASRSSSPPPTRTTAPPTVVTTTAPASVPTITPPVTSPSSPTPVQTTAPPAPPCTPEIAAVGAFAATGTQTVQISGSCLGTGNTSSGADTAYLRITDGTVGWNACWTNDPGTDSITCDISSWTASEITFGGFTGGYGTGTWVVSDGDDLEVQIWNPQSGQGPATCQVIVGSGEAADCSAR
jgi:eukaryotic-like serine/threonine-protein kinase